VYADDNSEMYTKMLFRSTFPFLKAYREAAHCSKKQTDVERYNGHVAVSQRLRAYRRRRKMPRMMEIQRGTLEVQGV
jgi:hypothetical protein